MEPSSIEPLIDDLSTSLNRVDDIVARLTSPTETFSKYVQTLPLLDRAKLLTTTAYALESLLLNALKLSGTDVQQHPINTELQRLKQYFEKIKLAENPNAVNKPEGMGVDKAAAGRFIKAGLAGNERWDRERATQIERERAGAAVKLKQLDNKRFRGKKRKFDERGQYLLEESVGERAVALSGEGEKVEMTGGKNKGGRQEGKRQKQKHKKKKSSRPPKSSKEALEALLKGPILPPPTTEAPSKGRKKRKKNKNNHNLRAEQYVRE